MAVSSQNKERLPELLEKYKDELAKIVDFNNITARIYKLKESQLAVANKLTAGKNGKTPFHASAA